MRSITWSKICSEVAKLIRANPAPFAPNFGPLDIDRADDAERARRTVQVAGHSCERIEQRGMIDVRHSGARPGQVERLAGRAERDQLPAEPFVADRQRPMDRAGMHQFAPDLVGDHQQVVTFGDLGVNTTTPSPRSVVFHNETSSAWSALVNARTRPTSARQPC